MASNGCYMLANDPGDSYTDSSFTYTIYKAGDVTGVTYSFGWEFTCDGVTTKETVTSGLTSSTFAWTPASAKFGPLMKKSQSGTLKIVVESTDGMNSTYTRSFTLKLNELIEPAVSNIAITRTNPFNNQSVSNITTHKLSFNVAGLYSASQTVTVTIGDAKYTKEVAALPGPTAIAVSFDIGSFDAGSSATLAKSIAISVTDARGRTGTASTSVTIYKYTPPAITKATVERNADEKPVLTFTYSYQATVAGATNTLQQFWARCAVGSNTYQTDLKGKTSPQVLTGTYDLGKAYQFLIALQDSVRPSAVIARANLPSDIPVMDIGADGNTVTFFGTSPSSSAKKSLRIAGDSIYLGYNNDSAQIDLCDGTGTIVQEQLIGRNNKEYSALTITAKEAMRMQSSNDMYLVSAKNGIQSRIDLVGNKDAVFYDDIIMARLGVFDMNTERRSSILAVGDRIEMGITNNDGTQRSYIAAVDDHIRMCFSDSTGNNLLSEVKCGKDGVYILGAKNDVYGGIQLTKPNGTWWVGGKTATNCIVAYPQSADSYHPVIRVNTSSKNVWNIGGLGNDVGIYGYYAARANDDNGYDFKTTWNTSNGDLNHSGAAIIGGRIYSGSYIDAVKHIHAQGDVMTDANFLANNGHGMYVKDTSGQYRSVIDMNNSNMVVVGYGPKAAGIGSTVICGQNIIFQTPQHNWLRPYYVPGDSITFSWDGAGFISAGGKNVYFFIPLSMPIIGVSAVSVSSVNGLTIRQNAKYLYGATSTTAAKPSSYSASCNTAGIKIKAVMNNATNVAYNNDACGINASIKITFS